MKKVCIVRQGRYPIDPRVRKEALALVEKGYQVDIICLADPRIKSEKRTDVDKGVNIHRILVSHYRKGLVMRLFEYVGFFVLASMKLCRLHFRNRYDFIQVNTLPDFLVFVTLLPKLLGAKVILDLHEPTPELYGSIFGAHRKITAKLLSFVEQASIRYADRAITVSEEMKNNYIKRGAQGSKITVVINVPTLEFRHEKYKEYHANNNSFSLICHGAILKRYGHDVAIKAIALLKDEIPEIHLDITGGGDTFEDELKKLVSQYGLHERVQFHGFIPFENMIKMLAKADIGIVPVRKNPYSDLVHTNKMFECIAMKKPVVITRTKAVEDFFGSDDTCLKYFESGNERDLARCVIELYKNPQKRENMVNNAFKKYEKVQWEILKEEYCKLFA